MQNAWELPTPLVDPVADEAIQGVLRTVGSPGSFFTAAERLEFAKHARFARGLTETPSSLPPVVASAVARIAVEAMTSRSEHVAAWEQDGRDVLAYIELVAVVSVICSIDSYRVGVGAPLDVLPDPMPGDPVPVIDDRAKKANSWVPTVGVALAPTALSALPNESAMKKPLGIAFYLDDKVVHQYDVEPGRELSRPQMELVASRTSWLNECFF
ncbi:MAG: hypothetical protein HKN94_10525 [Acidimicrobiales bacterium]|nr:hypothetical protein [Acidimicrobiales bacterium]RZV48130.1 MAG: hypothetical protein EX269_02785 [Acidimicrobiales bacterium]